MPWRESTRFVVEDLQPLRWVSRPSDWLEAFSSILAWVFAFLALSSQNLFAVTSSYNVMAHLAPQQVWGLLFLLVALGHSISLCAGFSRLRLAACILAASVWVFIGTLFGLAQEFRGMAAWLYITLGMFCMLSGIRNAQS